MCPQDLGLRDYARIDAWVMPDAPPHNTMTEEDKNAILNLEMEDHLVPWDFIAPGEREETSMSSSLAELSPEQLCRSGTALPLLLHHTSHEIHAFLHLNWLMCSQKLCLAVDVQQCSHCRCW